jgi:hypothetical protein
MAHVPAMNTHRNLSPATLGCPIAKAEHVIVCIHGRFASAEGILRMWEGIVGLIPESGGKVAVLAPQAFKSEWYPKVRQYI